MTVLKLQIFKTQVTKNDKFCTINYSPINVLVNFTVVVYYLSPLEFKSIYPSVKKKFGTGRKRYIDHHLFISFSLRERISRQNWGNVYQGKNVRCRSGQIYKNTFSSNFSFYGFLSSYKGTKRWKTDPSVNHPNQFEGECEVVHNYGKYRYAQVSLKINSRF